MTKKKKYTLDSRYDVDAVFTEEIRSVKKKPSGRLEVSETYAYEETPEERISALYDRKIVKYRTKTIKSGDVLECEIYPIWDNRGSMSRAPRAKGTRRAQKNLNDKNAIKTVTRLVNSNFTDDDVWITVTYKDGKLPKTVDEAEKNVGNYLRRLKYYGKKQGFPPLKYIYFTHFDGQRANHHIFINFPDRDILEKLWNGGARKQTRRLQADEHGYEGAVRYCMQDPKGKKRYKCSKNLEKPTVTVADGKITKRKVIRMIAGEINMVGEFENLYNGYDFTYYDYLMSDFVTGAYLYVKMTRKKQKKRRKT